MKFTFVVISGISVSIEVEADSLQEAIDTARNAPVMRLCHQCASGKEGAWNTSGELDCDPNSAQLEEAWIGDVESTAAIKPDWDETI